MKKTPVSVDLLPFGAVALFIGALLALPHFLKSPMLAIYLVLLALAVAWCVAVLILLVKILGRLPAPPDEDPNGGPAERPEDYEDDRSPIGRPNIYEVRRDETGRIIVED